MAETPPVGFPCYISVQGGGSFKEVNNGKKDMAGRRLLGDTDKRLRAFGRGGGKYLENEMPE